MSIRNLHSLFDPRSVAVIGASSKPHSVGATVLHNLIDASFNGTILPVNPKYDTLAGLKVYARIADLPETPDLAIICTPPDTIVKLIGELGERGTKAAIVLTAGLSAQKDGHSIKQAMLTAAKPHLLRILGPNCVGLLVPRIGLNASFAHTGALAGKIAFVSQSGGLVTGVLDWAKTRGIGFSKFISLGDSADIDFGDLLDYLASDGDTRAILMYVEDIHFARKFMSAARAAARSKPVIVLKAGRAPEAAKAAASHTGAMAGSDDVYDSAIRRAGMLRVFSTEELFSAVETLARAQPFKGDRLTIMTNGGGPGVMATDALMLAHGRLAALSPGTVKKLDEILPVTWSGANPVDIIGDAPVARYLQTLEILQQDPESDAILFIHAPTAIVPSAEIATAVAAVAAVAQQAKRNIVACWLGGDGVAQARQIFSAAGIPTYDTPEEAVCGFMQIVQYRRNQNLLMQVPPSIPTGIVPDFLHGRSAAQALVRAALDEHRSMLSENESKMLLAAYGIPVVDTRRAETVEAALACAQQIGYPVALKIFSPDITHKSDVGGVALDLETPEALRAAADGMQRRLQELAPNARLRGYTVQAMARRPGAHELIVGVSSDPVFGPVILFGQGGTAVEVTADHAIGLPPLNMTLARDMIGRTRVSRLLAGYRNRPAADNDAICRTLIQISHLVIDIPELVELDINPLLADENGVIALDARVRIAPVVTGAERLAIRPYPEELEEHVAWQDETLLLRPIKPEDAPQHLAFFNALDPEDVRYRIFTRMRELQPDQLARLTQIDYDREMAFIAVRETTPERFETLGVVRVISDPDNVAAEFAIIVRSDIKGKGLGHILLDKVIGYCRRRGTRQIVGEALAHNKGVLDLVRNFDFHVSPSADDAGTVMLRLNLFPEQAGAETNPASGGSA